jgi:hypothetical protein
MSYFSIPSGMTRRHFMSHLAGAAAMASPAIAFTNSLLASAPALKKQNKACILLWMGGGPATIDIWDLKPGSKNGGEFKPISTSGDLQISEHMPLTAKQMKHLSVIRSLNSKEGNHDRGNSTPDPRMQQATVNVFADMNAQPATLQATSAHYSL